MPAGCCQRCCQRGLQSSCCCCQGTGCCCRQSSRSCCCRSCGCCCRQRSRCCRQCAALRATPGAALRATTGAALRAAPSAAGRPCCCNLLDSVSAHRCAAEQSVCVVCCHMPLLLPQYIGHGLHADNDTTACAALVISLHVTVVSCACAIAAMSSCCSYAYFVRLLAVPDTMSCI